MSYYTQQQPPVRVPPPQGYPPKHAYPPPGYPAEGYAQGYPPQQPPRKETVFAGVPFWVLAATFWMHAFEGNLSEHRLLLILWF
ncbi:hypothetical protein Q3G72_032357 [Acer saccharum]|nr:hypothetical protein Q3G72_032357 [Acer saccharum]